MKLSDRSQIAGLMVLLASLLGLTSVPAQSTNANWTAPTRAARKENPVPTEAKSISQGKELYVAACLPCHGPAGKGDGPAAATLERNGVRVRPGNLSDTQLWLESDGALFWKISEGNTPMPSWRETLSDEQRWTVVNYVRTLAAKPQNKGELTKIENPRP